MKLVLRSVLLITAALPLLAQSGEAPSAQPAETPTGAQATQAPTGWPFRSAVELQFYNYGNFFQAREGTPERDVNAVGAAYRATWTRPSNAPDLYGRLSVLRYAAGASDTSYAGQIGLSKYATAHWYDVYLEHTRNGYSFDLEETRASANITSMYGHYSYGITDDWRVGADAYLDWQRFNVETAAESDYRSLGIQVRYRGFGDILKPRVGYVVGERDSQAATEVLDDRYWYVQVATEPRPGVELSVRYRNRTLDYRNVARTDDRNQWLLRATFKQNDRISWDASYRLEAVDSSLPGRDFDRNTAYVAVAYGF